MSLKQFFIGLGIFALLGATTTGLLIWWVYSTVFSPLAQMKEMPPEIQESRVLTGADFFSKSEFFKRQKADFLSAVAKASQAGNREGATRAAQRELSSGIDAFEDVATGEMDGQPGLDIAFAGRFSAFIIDDKGNLKTNVPYSFEKKKVKVGWFESETENSYFKNVKIVDFDGDGKCEFFGQGIWDELFAFNTNGDLVYKSGGSDVDFSELWDEKKQRERLESTPFVRATAVGDLEGDGTKELIVTMSNNTIYAFDRNGKEKWRRENNVSGDRLWIADLDGDGKAEIIELFSHNPKVRDWHGNVVKELKIDYQNNDDILFVTDKQKKQMQFLGISENKMSLVDENGKEFLKGDAPLSEIKLKEPRTTSYGGETFTFDKESVYKSRGTWAQFKKDTPKYLAVIANFPLFDRSHFYVYDPSGNLVYHEILPENCQTIKALPQENSTDAILVGGQQTVWRYNAK